MIDLYTWPTPDGQKVHIMLEESGLPYAVHAVDPEDEAEAEAGVDRPPRSAAADRESSRSTLLRLSPGGALPVIVDGNGPDGKPMTLFESGAILVYLAGKTERFLPRSTRGRYETLQWLMFEVGQLGPALGASLAPTGEQAGRLYQILETQLGHTGAWLVGRDYTIADMACWSWARWHERHGVDLSGYPNVARWHATIEARPAVQRALTVLVDRRRQAQPVA
ncbi:MAG: glutathione binding-like protein [Burkholderiaceae bacterium]